MSEAKLHPCSVIGQFFVCYLKSFGHQLSFATKELTDYIQYYTMLYYTYTCVHACTHTGTQLQCSTLKECDGSFWSLESAMLHPCMLRVFTPRLKSPLCALAGGLWLLVLEQCGESRSALRGHSLVHMLLSGGPSTFSQGRARAPSWALLLPAQAAARLANHFQLFVLIRHTWHWHIWVSVGSHSLLHPPTSAGSKKHRRGGRPKASTGWEGG